MTDVRIPCFSGRQLFLRAPHKVDINVYDLAHGLANLCCYNRQCRRFFSYAERAVCISHLVEAEGGNPLPALLMDAPAAYIGDTIAQLVKPGSAIATAHFKILRAVEERFAISFEQDGAMAEDAALRIDASARAYFWPQEGLQESGGVDLLLGWVPRCMPPADAKELFQERVFDLIGPARAVQPTLEAAHG